MDQCFKLIGYPDWYEISKERNKGKGTPRVAAHVYTQNPDSVQDTPIEDSPSLITNTTVSSGDFSAAQFDPSMVQALTQEIMKFFKGNKWSSNLTLYLLLLLTLQVVNLLFQSLLALI